MTKTDVEWLLAIDGEYAPYGKMQAFVHGFEAYRRRDSRCPHSQDSVHAQAWDRGMQCARRYEREVRK